MSDNPSPLPLPQIHIQLSPLSSKVEYLSCDCSWRTVFTHDAMISYQRSLEIRNDIIESHYRQHIKDRFDRIRNNYHGVPDVYRGIARDTVVRSSTEEMMGVMDRFKVR